MNFFIILYLLLCSCLNKCYSEQLKINLICPANGKGLEIDGNVLLKALTSLECSVTWLKENKIEKTPYVDINIFCEQFRPEIFRKARFNWFIPNPEWYVQNLELLKNIDLILCRTKEVERIFNALDIANFFLGFTTPDAYLPEVPKDFQSFIHVAGGSPYKGTLPIFTAWKENPSFPLLTIVRSMSPPTTCPPNLIWIIKRLPKKKLREVQNQSAIHLCLSETEGFGHYLMEAMSCSAVTITTDAPPMNEFISDPRYLVAHDTFTQQRLANRYLVTSKAIEERIHAILNLSQEELKATGAQNRALYLEKDREFHENLKELITQTRSFISHQTLRYTH